MNRKNKHGGWIHFFALCAMIVFFWSGLSMLRPQSTGIVVNKRVYHFPLESVRYQVLVTGKHGAGIYLNVPYDDFRAVEKGDSVNVFPQGELSKLVVVER